MSQINLVWNQISTFLSSGLSLIPVRDKETTVEDRVYAAKSPYSTWKHYQKEIVSQDFLWSEMEKYDTTAIAIICGQISGNLEVIDIDIKHKPGVDALIFQQLNDLYPDLFKSLRIHKTPSGGYHILYRVQGTVLGGNQKISGRNTTDEEKLEYKRKNPLVKKDLEAVYFVETRGEGGYVVAPPSLGYSNYFDVPIPTLTSDERESIINVCKSFNEIIKEVKVYKPSQKEMNLYDVNPFHDFSHRANPVHFLESINWMFVKQREGYLWFTRPGGSKNNVHGSFDESKKVFFNYSTNTGLDQDKAYYLATLLIEQQFAGDKKKTYAWLVENGYGKVNPKVEKETVRIKAINGGQLPNNFSKDAQEGFEEFKKHLHDLHPFGAFWDLDEESRVEISRQRFYEVSACLGFRYYEQELYQLIGNYIYKRDTRFYYDTMKDYIKIEDEEIKEDIINAYEYFIQKNGDFSITRLPLIIEDLILKDTKTTCNKFYQDCWLEINRSEIIKRDYSELQGYVFADRIHDRVYRNGAVGRYVDFLNKSCELYKHADYIHKIAGYLCHEFKDETMAYIIVLTEKCTDPKDGGGTGKNIFCDLLKYTTTYISKPGKQTKTDEKFFQSWNGERIFAISDLPKDFDFEFLKEPSSGTGIQKKLFKDEVVIPVHRMPKFICQTQFSFEIKDGGLKRRIIPLEFTDFFTKSQGVDTYYNDIHFPKGWDEDDWAGYDGFIIYSIQTWLKGGCKLQSQALSDTGWTKQFEFTYGPTIHNIILSLWDRWIRIGFVSNDDFVKMLTDYYIENGTPMNYRPSPQKLNLAIQDYSRHNEFKFMKDVSEKVNGINTKGRIFKSLIEDEVPF